MDSTSLFFISVIGIIIYVVLTRWIFRVNEHINNQETIIDMLGQLLLKQGLSVEQVRTLLAKYGKK